MDVAPADHDAVWEGFARAVVRVELTDGTLLIEPRPSRETAGTFPFERAVHIITAYHPNGEWTDEESNRRADAALGEAVALHRSHRTVGSAPDGSMAEPGYAIEGLDRSAAIELGRRFGQRAIYEWSPAGLDVLAIDGSTTHRSGWAVTREQHRDPTGGAENDDTC